MKHKPDYKALNRAIEHRMAAAANGQSVNPIQVEWTCQISAREIEAGRAYERAAIADAERTAARRRDAQRETGKPAAERKSA